MEFYEDCKNVKKKLQEVETQTSKVNLGILNLSNPPTLGIDRCEVFFLIDFDIWNVDIVVRMRKLWLFYEWTPN